MLHMLDIKEICLKKNGRCSVKKFTFNKILSYADTFDYVKTHDF